MHLAQQVQHSGCISLRAKLCQLNEMAKNKMKLDTKSQRIKSTCTKRHKNVGEDYLFADSKHTDTHFMRGYIDSKSNFLSYSK